MIQNQRLAQYYQQFSQQTAAQKALWDVLVDTNAASFAKLARYRSGSIIFDSTTVTELKCYYNTGIAQRVWAGGNCEVHLYVAGAAITKNRFVVIDVAPNLGDVIVPAAQGDIHGGVALNTALEDELVYVMTQGCALVELSNPAVAIAAGARVTTDSAGRALAVADDEFYMSYCQVPNITVAGVQYARVGVRLPVHTPAVIP